MKIDRDHARIRLLEEHQGRDNTWKDGNFFSFVIGIVIGVALTYLATMAL